MIHKNWYIFAYRCRQHPLYAFIGFILLVCAITGGALIYLDNTRVQAAPSGYGFWNTKGSKLVDSYGSTVKITGVTWFGFETDTYAPHGLWKRHYKEMISQIKAQGYNTIRLPFSNKLFDPGYSPSGIDYVLNPELEGLSSLQILDEIIQYAGQADLKIILVRDHTEESKHEELWYTDTYSEQRWIRDWQFLAERYKHNPTVVGVDLHHEPHGKACWGCGEKAYDWKAAAEKAGNAILSVNPEWLIIVEGVQSYNGKSYWWGSNLMGVADNPVKLKIPDKVVYSVHEYPETVAKQPWFTDSTYPDNMPAIWDSYWGYISKKNIAPVLVSEFGSSQNEKDITWMKTLLEYLGTDEHGISWIYWAWNPNAGDTGGLVQNDWTTIDQEKYVLLAPYMFALQAHLKPVISPIPKPSATMLPRDAQESTAEAASVPCTVYFSIVEENEDTFIANITLQNNTFDRIDGWYMTWDFSSGEEVIRLWNGIFTQSGNTVTVKNVSWNTMLSPKGILQLGFEGKKTNGAVVPATFTINQRECSVEAPAS